MICAVLVLFSSTVCHAEETVKIATYNVKYINTGINQHRV